MDISSEKPDNEHKDDEEENEKEVKLVFFVLGILCLRVPGPLVSPQHLCLMSVKTLS